MAEDEVRESIAVGCDRCWPGWLLYFDAVRKCTGWAGQVPAPACQALPRIHRVTMTYPTSLPLPGRAGRLWCPPHGAFSGRDQRKHYQLPHLHG
jgi:hypothetical protein